MTLSKGAVGNLVNRYRAVLKKCHLMNMFGSLAVVGLLVAGSAVSATANENTATAIAGDGKPVVVDKGVINGRVIGGSAAGALSGKAGWRCAGVYCPLIL